MAKVIVTLKVDLDVNAWATEYGHGPATGLGFYAAVKEALSDLRDPDYYLTEEKWRGLVEVREAEATLVF